MIFLDSGLAGHLSAGGDPDARSGRLIENFVLGELARQLTWSSTWAQLFPYRDRDQYEVDAVLENNAGEVLRHGLVQFRLRACGNAHLGAVDAGPLRPVRRLGA